MALQNELDVATGIQQSILPTQFPSSNDYQVFANMEPARNVGGDFYDVVNLEDDRIGLAIADVSDKGVPAALFMMSSRTWMKGSAIGNPEPERGTGRSQLAAPRRQRDADVRNGAVRGVRSGNRRHFTYASGGHDAPLLVRADGTSELLPLTGGIALGLIPGLEYNQNSVTLNQGETLVLYTDGVTEAMNGEGEQFGVERLREVFSNAVPKDSGEATRMIFEAVNAFADGAAQSG